MSRVQWNQTFLLVKNFKLFPRLLDEGLRPRWIKLWFSLHGIILEGKSIGLNYLKKSLNKSSWFGKSKCKLGSKVVRFLVFLFFPLFSVTLVVQIMWEWKARYGLRTLLRAQQLQHLFLPIIKLTWLVLWILTRWLLGVHL